MCWSRSSPAPLIVLPFIDIDKFTRTGDLPTYATAVPLIGRGSVYSVVLLAWLGRTLGCWVCGIRVARYADGGQAHARAGRPAVAAAGVDCRHPDPDRQRRLDRRLHGLAVQPAASRLPGLAGGTVVIRTR